MKTANDIISVPGARLKQRLFNEPAMFPTEIPILGLTKTKLAHFASKWWKYSLN